MTRDEIVLLIKQRARRDADATLDARIVTELKYAQNVILEGGLTLPWFLLSDNVPLTTVIDDERVSIPTNVDSVTGKDFLREHEESALWYYDTTNVKWVELIKDDYDSLLNKYPSGTGTPKYYSLDGYYFRLKPTPNAILTLRLRCFLREPVLLSNIENAWTKYAPDLLVGEAGARIAATHLRDTVLQADFEREAQRARQRLFLVDEARKHANREMEMGD